MPVRNDSLPSHCLNRMKVGDITIKTIFLNDLSIVSLYLSIAFIGHFLTHLPLSMQRLKIYHRKTFGILWNCPDRTRLNQRTNMVVRTYTLVYLYHSSFFCKISQTILFYKIDFI